MARYRTSVAHDLGRQTALERLRRYSEEARGFSNIEGSWSGCTYTFSGSVQGIRVHGTLRVQEETLELDSQLPLVAMPFARWVDRMLRFVLNRQPPRIAAESPQPRSAQLSPADPELEHGPTSPVVLYLHIPKAGGSTLGSYIYSQCRSDDGEDQGLLNAGVLFLSYGFFKEPDLSVPEFIRALLHRPDLRAVTGHFWFGIHEHLSRPWTYVTLLRDPVERIVSLYHYLQLSDRMTLEEFISSPPFKEVDNDQTRRIAGVDPEIGECTAAELRTAQENLREHFAVVGVTERFDETLVLLKRRFAWSREVLSYPKNVSEGRTRTSSLAPRVIEAIRDRNRLDLELHAYATQLFDEAVALEGRGFQDDLERYRSLRYAPATP